MNTLLTATSVVLAAVSALIIAANFVIARQWIRGGSISFVPLVGALAGASALLLWPHHALDPFAWLPAVLDWGTLLAVPFWAVHSRNRRQRTLAVGETETVARLRETVPFVAAWSLTVGFLVLASVALFHSSLPFGPRAGFFFGAILGAMSIPEHALRLFAAAVDGRERDGNTR